MSAVTVRLDGMDRRFGVEVPVFIDFAFLELAVDFIPPHANVLLPFPVDSRAPESGPGDFGGGEFD